VVQHAQAADVVETAETQERQVEQRGMDPAYPRFQAAYRRPTACDREARFADVQADDLRIRFAQLRRQEDRRIPGTAAGDKCPEALREVPFASEGAVIEPITVACGCRRRLPPAGAGATASPTGFSAAA